MMQKDPKTLLQEIEHLKQQVSEYEYLIEAIKAGEVDAFRVNDGNGPQVYTLQSGDYAYRLLIEKFNEGALNVTDNGLIVYCNQYFSDLIHVPNEQLVGTSIFEHSTPDFNEELRNLIKKAFSDGTAKGEINLNADGSTVSVYVSLTSLLPHMDTVGIIVSDLTKQKEYERFMAAKNVELQNQNSELASFTYIASHDLQEPLRKIQTFTGRIVSNEGAAMSDKSRDYFDRIVNAASRMQMLIQDLLTYSRTNTVNLEKTETDLNLVLDDVKRNLQDDIESKNLVIEASPLPVVMAAHTQINQLFSNIINNSVKYHKPDVAAHIKIAADIVNASELTFAANIPHLRYWKISFKDNGIGFENEYSQKIFELFQRLHGKGDYPGTGIGLAICKKIVQNHDGYINAESELGQGSTFNIYLPTNIPS